MDDIYKNIEEYNPNKKLKILIFLIIWLLISLVKKHHSIINELFIGGRELNISFVFITQYHLAVPAITFQCMIIHQILTLRAFRIFTETCTAKPYCFLVIDSSLASDNSSHFRKNISERI